MTFFPIRIVTDYMDRPVHSSVVFASDLISQLGADLLAVRLVLSVGEAPLWPSIYLACPAARCAKRAVILKWLTARLVTTLSANGGGNSLLTRDAEGLYVSIRRCRIRTRET